MQSRKKRVYQNYRNFGWAILAIVGMMLFILFIASIGYAGFTDGLQNFHGESAAYNRGRAAGRFAREVVNFYLAKGFIFGNIIAVVASLEKRNSFSKWLVHGILGWGYVIYYAITRKTVSSETVL